MFFFIIYWFFSINLFLNCYFYEVLPAVFIPEFIIFHARCVWRKLKKNIIIRWHAWLRDSDVYIYVLIAICLYSYLPFITLLLENSSFTNTSLTKVRFTKTDIKIKNTSNNNQLACNNTPTFVPSKSSVFCTVYLTRPIS